MAELTGLFDLSGWPEGMRLIVRNERPHPGAQLRVTDVDGHRITAFVTNTGRGQLADLELRHRRRARAEDRIRCAKDTGLTNLPLHDFAQNEIWCAIVALACELTASMQTLALTGHQGPPVGTQTATAAAVHRPGDAGPHRPPPAAAPGRPSPLGRHHHRRDHCGIGADRGRGSGGLPAPCVADGAAARHYQGCGHQVSLGTSAQGCAFMPLRRVSFWPSRAGRRGCAFPFGHFRSLGLVR